ncbi:hypothetical protein G6O67_007026 [Ophiocordyceps sinensis]|uniref:Nucleolar protein 12 n=1 Tax=Ophiocordyceps sinensis TaxID=72228 RepID=A0A8H4PNJ3_9HYPO|nr:hypothetical protein G6O67_007026 [Ophiocordyceps sinensis]
MPKRNPAPTLGLASKAIDPTLDALFASSSGPVKAPHKSRYSAAQELRVPDADDKEPSDQEVDEVLSEASQELDYDDEDEPTSNVSGDDAPDKNAEKSDEATSADEAAETEKPRRERKRKRKEDNEDLEANYLAELTKHDVAQPAEKRLKGEKKHVDTDGDVPVHESLTQDSGAPDLDRAGRTVFLGNVSAEAITSKKAKKTLITHLSSVLDQNDAAAPQKLESIRFRSVAFSTGSMPKRAAYITKSVMSATTQSANAYAVFSSPAAARKVASELNGSEVLGRHIRVDSVAHPSVMAHRRCVFVGNLGFVDDETVVRTDGEGKTVEKKRNKIPSDVEEGLWRTFLKQGKVENVRVVRDPKTRVGKGFAYVQFYDVNDVESALLLDGKKFPPMLPRALRVTRAKDPRKTATAQERNKAKAIASSGAARRTKYEHKSTAEEQAAAGRAGKLLGRAGAAKQRTGAPGSVSKTPEQIVFEGRRASSKDGRPKDLKLGKKSPGKPQNRGARRAAGWKKKAA